MAVTVVRTLKVRVESTWRRDEVLVINGEKKQKRQTESSRSPVT